MGNYVFYGTIAFVAVIAGMLLYPTIYNIVSGISVAGFLDITKAGMVVLSYVFLFFIGYTVYRIFKR